MKKEPTALKIYKWLFLSVMLLNTISMAKSDPYTSSIIAVIVNGVIVGIWYLLYLKMVNNDKSDIVRWILSFLTFPLGLILMAPSTYPDQGKTQEE